VPLLGVSSDFFPLAADISLLLLSFSSHPEMQSSHFLCISITNHNGIIVKTKLSPCLMSACLNHCYSGAIIFTVQQFS